MGYSLEMRRATHKRWCVPDLLWSCGFEGAALGGGQYIYGQGKGQGRDMLQLLQGGPGPLAFRTPNLHARPGVLCSIGQGQ